MRGDFQPFAATPSTALTLSPEERRLTMSLPKRSLLLALSYCGLSALGLGGAAHAQRLTTKPTATLPATLDTRVDGGFETRVSDRLAWVTPLGGRVSALLTALYQNYTALHPTRLTLEKEKTPLPRNATALAVAATAGTSALATLDDPAPTGVDYAALSKVGDTKIRVVSNMVVVDITVTGDVATARRQLEALGMVINGEFDNYLGGALPIPAVGQVAQMANVAYADAERGYKLNTGATTTQGDAAQRSDTARTTYSVKGAGKKVGVLSDSFNKSTAASKTYANDVSSGDLPAASASNTSKTGMTVLVDGAGGTDEGRAMLQIIYDVAPEAGLAFATASDNTPAFAQNIRNLRNVAACDVIVDDVIFFKEPFFADGVVAQAVDEVVANGAAYFSSAGNSGRTSYEGFFRDSGVPLTITNSSATTNYVLHDFDPGTGVDTRQRITLAAGATFNCGFQWDDPYKSVSATSTGAVTDLDIFLYKADGTLVAQGSFTNANGDPSEEFQYPNATGSPLPLDVVIGRRSTTSGTPYMKYVDFGGSTTFNEFGTSSGTAVGHTNAAGCESVGAAAWFNTPDFGYNTPLLETYSSAGGTPIRRDKTGKAIAPLVRQTPDIVAPDGGNTTFFGQDLNDAPPNYTAGDGYPNFFGTSAAAPHAAGVAALMLQANGSATPSQIYRSLERTALDMGTTTGYDVETGYGLINANSAIKDIKALSSATLGVVISEFRERGTNGTEDEYVELYNTTGNAVNIGNWTLQYRGGASNTPQNLAISANTIIPAFGHYLIVGTGYSLANYGGTGLAAGNQTIATGAGISDASVLALFNTSSVAQDLVTFGSGDGGLATAPTANGEYAFVRQYDSVTGMPLTGSNSYVFVATNGGSYAGSTKTVDPTNGQQVTPSLVAVLGAPGPKNLTSPTVNTGVRVALLNPSLDANVTPNRVRDISAVGTNAAVGTLSVRRLITNNTGKAVTRLRFRLVNLTTLNSKGYNNSAQADLRILAGPSATQNITVNGQPITVYGTTLQTPPAQAAGGGMNSSVISGVVTLGAPLANGTSQAYDFTFGVQRGGTFTILLSVESTTS